MIALDRTQPQELMEESVTQQGVTGYPAMVDGLMAQTPWGMTGEEDGMQTVSEVSAAPMQTVEETFRNSWKGMLSRNLGRDMLVTFLVGSQDTVVAHGTLYEVGNDYISLYHPERDSYITGDIYSVRFVEINPTETGEGPN